MFLHPNARQFVLAISIEISLLRGVLIDALLAFLQIIRLGIAYLFALRVILDKLQTILVERFVQSAHSHRTWLAHADQTVQFKLILSLTIRQSSVFGHACKFQICLQMFILANATTSVREIVMRIITQAPALWQLTVQMARLLNLTPNVVWTSAPLLCHHSMTRFLIHALRYAPLDTTQITQLWSV